MSIELHVRHITKDEIERVDSLKNATNWNVDGSYWLDIRTDDRSELEDYFDKNLSEIDVDKAGILYVTRPLESTRIHVGRKALALNIPLPDEDPLSPPEYVSLIITTKNLISVSGLGSNFLNKLVEETNINPFPIPINFEIIIYFIVSEILNQTMVDVLHMRKSLKQIMTKMNDEDYEIELEEIVETKNKVYYLSSIVEEQLYIIGSIPKLDWDRDKSVVEVLDEIRNLYRSFEFLLSNLERQEDKLEAIHDQYQSKLQEIGNKKLNTLTIVQSIFVPLTLISGLYGMNFHWMPELEWRYGYFIVLGIMGLIILIELWWFRKKGWFD